MNHFIKKFVQFAVVAVAFFAGAQTFAASFNPQPMGNHGFATINTNCSSNCANQKNSISYNELPSSKEFTVYLNFHNQTPGDIQDARGQITYSSSGNGGSVTFQGRLSGTGANSITDTASITNLPANWQIQFVSGMVRVEEHYSNQGTPCTGTFPGNWPWQHSFSNPGNANIGDLHYFSSSEGGWCDQGYVFAKFKVVANTPNDPDPINGQCRVYNGVYPSQPATNTSTGCLAGTYQDTSDTQTQWRWQCVGQNGGATTSCSAARQTIVDPQHTYSWQYGNWGSCINNVQTRTAQCVRNDGVVVSDSYCLNEVGPKPAPQTRTCGIIDQDDLRVQTLSATNITETRARLNGEITSGDTNYVYFVLGTNSNITCSSNNKYFPYDFNVPRDAGDSFSYTFPNGSLNSETRYYYRACAQDNGYTASGQVLSFETEDDDDNGDYDDDIEIRTEAPQSVTRTTANLCATLVEDGGSQVQTWIEYRRSSSNSWSQTSSHQRYEGYFCQSVSGLSSNTSYVYRACTPEGCASTRTFRTLDDDVNYDPGEAPIIVTDDPSNIRSNSATLSGTYVTNAPSGTCWFEYGRTAGLGSQTRSYSVGSGYGTCVHNFTNLAANQQYCVRAVIQTVNGTARGGIKCFTTPGVIYTGGGSTTVVTQPQIIVVEENPEIDLASLGLGLSLVRLDIDDDNEVVFPGQQVNYEVTWENISHIDLDNLQLKVTLPSKITITNASRGRINPEDNSILYTIDDLDAGEQGGLTIGGVIGKATVGTVLTAQAELAYENPINFAQENALDFDINDVGTRIAGVTASIFGLGNITFLGWLVILLGLFIIFLIARYLYLEREELRAQAYMNGYAPYVPPYAPPAPPQDDYYNPYRPNRG